MKKTYKILLTFFLISITASCRHHNDYYVSDIQNWKNSPYINESSLIEISSEKINFSLDESDILTQITKVLESRSPTRAELSCDPTDINCSQIKKILISFSVPIKNLTKISTERSKDVSLIYEKISELDCYQKLNVSRNLAKNPYLGCAVTSNILKMVDNKEQFVSPKLLSLTDAEKAIKSARKLK